MASELFPIIVTADLDGSVAFYRDLLGGVVTYEFAGADGTPAYVGVQLGTSQLGIGADVAAERAGRTVSLWVYTENCDALVERLREAGVTIVDEPRDEPWGERVAKVEDPTGIHVHVASR